MALFKISSKIYGAWSVDEENEFIDLNIKTELPEERGRNSRNDNGRVHGNSQITENEREN